MSEGFRGLLRSSRVRGAAQLAVIVALVLIGFQVYGLRSDNTERAATVTAVGSILARTCGAASFDDLREQGLVEECRLAQQGELGSAIPDEELPDPDAKPDEVDPDVVADDKTATPADIEPAPEPKGPTNDQVSAAVDDYFEAHPLDAQPGYERAVQRTVAAYLTKNPPEAGRAPTRAEVRKAVQTVLLANPPADGTDGRGVASATLDGCDVVFAYSDGSTQRVGPLCGPKGDSGPAPTDEQIAQAVVTYCEQNGECRGPQGDTGAQGPTGPPGVVAVADECNPPDGQYVVDTSLAYDAETRTVTIRCTSALLPIGPGSGSP